MIGFNALNGEITQIQWLLRNFFQVADAGLELIKSHREVAVALAVVKVLAKPQKALGQPSIFMTQLSRYTGLKKAMPRI